MKKISLIVAVLALASLTILPIEGLNGGRAETKKDLDDSMLTLTKYASDYAMAYKELEGKDHTTIEINNTTMQDVASIVRWDFYDDYDFEAKELETTAKNIFGKSITVDAKDTILVKAASEDDGTDLPYCFSGGEWGDAVVSATINSINEKDEGIVIDGTADLVDTETDETDPQLHIIVTLKQKDDTKYGYIITGIEYQEL